MNNHHAKVNPRGDLKAKKKQHEKTKSIGHYIIGRAIG